METVRENVKWQGRLGCCMVVSMFVVGWPLALLFWLLMVCLEKNRKSFVKNRLTVVTLRQKIAVRCVICWETDRPVEAKLPCLHTFHTACIHRWTLAQHKGTRFSDMLPCTCPLCRKVCYVIAKRGEMI